MWKTDRLFYNKREHVEQSVIFTTTENIQSGIVYSWIVKNCSKRFNISEPEYPEDGSLRFNWYNKNGLSGIEGSSCKIVPGTMYVSNRVNLKVVKQPEFLRDFIPLEPFTEEDVISLIDSRCEGDVKRKEDCEFGLWLASFLKI